MLSHHIQLSYIFRINYVLIQILSWEILISMLIKEYVVDSGGANIHIVVPHHIQNNIFCENHAFIKIMSRDNFCLIVQTRNHMVKSQA
jgi:hypothetical protein